jgi:hypothetical protein
MHLLILISSFCFFLNIFVPVIQRISADAAFNHEWFREVPLPKTKDFMPTLPALNEQDRYWSSGYLCVSNSRPPVQYLIFVIIFLHGTFFYLQAFQKICEEP